MLPSTGLHVIVHVVFEIWQ